MSGRAPGIALAMLTALGLAASARAQIPPPELGLGPVYWIPVDDGGESTFGMVDPWLSYFVRRNVEAAREANASALIFAIKTYGGRVDSAIEISDTIMACKDIPTIAYVDGRAISAGALIAFACDYVYMRTESMMGDAQAVMQTEEGPKPVGEKIDTVMRARFRLELEKRADRVPHREQAMAIAEALTDVTVELIRVEVDGKIIIIRESELSKFIRDQDAAGVYVRVFEREVERDGKMVTEHETVLGADKLLTMTSREALEDYQIIDGVVKSRGELLDLVGKAESDVVQTEASWPQEIARFIGGGLVSGLLLSIAMLGLMMELYAPGKGVGGFIFLFGIILFFWSHFLAGQAGPVEVVLFLLGVGLLAVEVFVIPGFGVAGISGIVLIVLSLVLAFLPGDVVPETPAVEFPWDSMWDALTVVMLSLLASIVGISVLARYLPRAPIFNELMTEPPSPDSVTVSATPGGKPLDSYVGKSGVASTDLRPSGKVKIESDVIDAVAEGEFIPEGTRVRVTEVAGNRVVVDCAGADPTEGEAGGGQDAGGVA